MFSRSLFIWPVHNVILLLSLLFLPFLCYSTVATWPPFCHDSTLLCPVFNSIKLIQPINVSIFFCRFSFSLLCCFPVALSRPFVAPSFLSLWKFVYFGLTMHACNDDQPCTPIHTFHSMIQPRTSSIPFHVFLVLLGPVFCYCCELWQATACIVRLVLLSILPHGGCHCWPQAGRTMPDQELSRLLEHTFAWGLK